MSSRTARLQHGRSWPAMPNRTTIAAWCFLAPSLLVLAVFVFWPIVYSFDLSLHKWKFSADAQEWAGFANYARMWRDARFWNALGNTVYYTAFTVPLGVALPLALALALNRAIPFRALLRSAFFLPVIASFAIVALAWRFMLDPDIGLLAYWLSFLGMPHVSPLRDPNMAMPAVIIASLWKNLGFNMVIYLAGLQAIPIVLYEAARIDGADRFQQFWNVTWPQLRTTNIFVLVISIIGAFQVFDPAFVMTPGGGPLFSTETLVTYIYRQGITNLNLSYAASIGIFLFAVVFLLTLAQLRLTRSWED
ncbi:MAG TPA: sugar ABC transporter permease [Kaistia sp.]|nr:sugar ABC transporter permease [Kaistia sp.]